MHDNRLDAQRLCSQELSHVHTEVTNLSECVCVCLRACVCIWLCLLYPCNSESVNRTGTGRGPARGRARSPSSGSLDVAELFMRFCCETTLAAPRRRRSRGPRARGNRTSEPLSAGRCRRAPTKEQLGLSHVGPSQEVTLAPGLACVINIIAALCPVACVTQGIIKVLI